MLKHPPLAALTAAALLAVPLQALASTDSWHNSRERDNRWERHDDDHQRGHGHDRHGSGPEMRLVEKYDRFAGSERNARELVEGLRNDSQVDLSKGGKTTSFKPATDKMGYGNVDLALGLAQASLAEHGIHNPKPEQIKAALNGGTITTKSGQRVTLAGVLKLRASGMGWGQVAHKLGIEVGDVKGHRHAHNKPEFHRAKFERPERAQRPEKIERPHRPERPERPERHHRGH
jgi:hypothetical protein